MYDPISSNSEICVRVETRFLGWDRTECSVHLAEEHLTVAQLIRSKIAAEWAAGGPTGLESVQPGEAAVPWLSLEAAVRNALDAYRAGWYVISVDGDQPSGLDTSLHLTTDSHVLFARLFPLKGGLL